MCTNIIAHYLLRRPAFLQSTCRLLRRQCLTTFSSAHRQSGVAAQLTARLLSMPKELVLPAYYSTLTQHRSNQRRAPNDLLAAYGKALVAMQPFIAHFSKETGPEGTKKQPPPLDLKNLDLKNISPDLKKLMKNLPDMNDIQNKIPEIKEGVQNMCKESCSSSAAPPEAITLTSIAGAPLVAPPLLMLLTFQYLPGLVMMQCAYTTILLAFFSGTRFDPSVLPKAGNWQNFHPKLPFLVAPPALGLLGIMMPTSLCLMSLMGGVVMSSMYESKFDPSGSRGMSSGGSGSVPWDRGLRQALLLTAGGCLLLTLIFGLLLPDNSTGECKKCKREGI